MACAAELAALRNEVLAMDLREEPVQELSPVVTQAVVADGRREDVLRSLGVPNFDCAVVCTGEDVAASILIVMQLKELGVARVVCKASNETHKKALLKVGADRVVIPEREMAVKLARSLQAKNVVDYMPLSDDYAVMELTPPVCWEGKSLRQLDLRAKYGIHVMAIRRGGETVVLPGAEECLQSGDTCMAMGRSGDLAKVEAL